MNWQQEYAQNITTAEALATYLPLSADEIIRIDEVIKRYPMSISRYYLSLIDPKDPNDPIRKMAVPSGHELLEDDGSFDTSGEGDNTVLDGLQHKYRQTALLLSTNLCAMYCRHCFRKRLVGLADEEIMKQFDHMVDYIATHQEVSNVLITGGDALLNSNRVLEYYLKTLVQFDHLDFIRFGSRLPVTFPMRISEDEELLALLKKYSQQKTIYVVTQFNHPNELTDHARKAIKALLDCHIIVSNQTVLLKGVNDDSDVLSSLMRGLTSMGVIPYYVFQCRPVTGVKDSFQIPLKQGAAIVDSAKSQLNGLAKRFRYVMSHPTGKIEILGQLQDEMLFKYHQAKYPTDQSRIFMQSLSDDDCWLGEIKGN